MSSVREVLAAHRNFGVKTHQGDAWKYDGTQVCQCGQEFVAESGAGGAFTAHTAHVAAALAAAGIGDTAAAEHVPTPEGTLTPLEGLSVLLDELTEEIDQSHDFPAVSMVVVGWLRARIDDMAPASLQEMVLARLGSLTAAAEARGAERVLLNAADDLVQGRLGLDFAEAAEELAAVAAREAARNAGAS